MAGPSRVSIALGAALLCAWMPLAHAQDERFIPRPLSVNPQYAAALVLYQMKCAACHGERGDGRGPAAHLLDPRPADLTSGIFKLRSTPSGSLPVDGDLQRTLEQGVHGTAMRPRAADLSAPEMSRLIELVKSFSPRFGAGSPRLPCEIPAPPGSSSELIVLGRDTYVREGCAQCHGDFGRGDGPDSRQLTDHRGLPARPHDFTLSGGVKAGARDVDFFRSLTTGLDGTPMQAYDRLSFADRWALVYFLMSLSEQPAPDIGPHDPSRVIGRRQ